MPVAPRAELHVHLRGAMPREFFAKKLAAYPLAEALSNAPDRHRTLFGRFDHLRRLLDSPSPDAADLYRFQSFEGFLASYLFSAYFIRSVEDFRDLVAAVQLGFKRQRLAYVEVTVSIHEYAMNGIPLEAIAEAMEEAARRPGPRLRWIVDLIRNLGPAVTLDYLRRFLRCRPPSWVGITLGGSEHLYPPGPFVETYDLARAEGLGLTIHAGEALGPESVWEALRLLRVDRIGHGVRAIEDRRLVERLAETGVPLEICPTGNVLTGIYRSIGEHPLAELHRAGVAITLNTDDPTFFGVDLAHEYETARRVGLSESDLRRVARNAEIHAFDR